MRKFSGIPRTKKHSRSFAIMEGRCEKQPMKRGQLGDSITQRSGLFDPVFLRRTLLKPDQTGDGEFIIPGANSARATQGVECHVTRVSSRPAGICGMKPPLFVNCQETTGELAVCHVVPGICRLFPQIALTRRGGYLLSTTDKLQ